MDLLLVADGHYYRDKKGDIYVQSVFDYSFYKRYLNVFDNVYAVARIEDVNEAPAGKKKASGERVIFLDFPVFKGPWQYARSFFYVKKVAKKYAEKFQCAIFRLPGATANIMCKEYAKTGKPFAVEIVIDPWENFAPGSGTGILRPIIRWSWTNTVKNMCMKANGASYVTEHYLQERYPCPALSGRPGYFTSFYSSVELPDETFAEPRMFDHKDSWYIAHTANTLADYCKGHIQLMNAVKVVRDKGYDVRIRFIGDGPKRGEFQDYAKKINIDKAVEFMGRLPSTVEVRKVYAQSDMFVFPTKAEGLPRGLLEAMAEGLPCISSPTCGIPEVLQEEYLYDYDDAEGFANGIISLIEKPYFMNQLSKDNLHTALKYKKSLLEEKRNSFYTELITVVKNGVNNLNE